MKNRDIKKIERLNKKNNNYLIRWQMTTLCNYYCDFCIQGNKENHVKKSKGENKKIRNDICNSIIKFIEEELNKKYKSITLNLIGGEITILPEFLAILEKFINCKFKGEIEIHITTNLSANIKVLNKMKNLIKDKKNRKLSISASFYKGFSTEEEFIKKAKIFAKSNTENNFINKLIQLNSNIIFKIAIPLVEDEDYAFYLKFKEKYKKLAFSINYIIINDYKKSISKDLKDKLGNNNKKKIKITLKDNRVKYYSSTSKISLDIEDEQYFNPHDFLCDSGINNITIDNLGNISRCPTGQKNTRVGLNIINGNFKLITEKFNCPNFCCNCDCYGVIENQK